jgi:23S rRNA pseudouridine1911/1915/1917 synthase
VAERRRDAKEGAVVLGAEDTGETLAAVLRRRLRGKTWSEAKRLCTTGKIRVDGRVQLDPTVRLAAGQAITIDMAAPRPHPEPPGGFRIVFEDVHVVVIEKPSGVSTVPFERKETGTAMDLVRAAWRHAGKRATATPLYVVHRIDKDTSGLVCFAKTRLAERGLHQVFQRHEASRVYLAVAEGAVPALRIESRLVADRGDGIRGSTRHAGQGQHAVTHVWPLRQLRGAGRPATLCKVQLETGRTHQIRIHLAERGHPLLGETVYVRDLQRAGGTPLGAPRLMLHAALLGFHHPVTGAALEWRSMPPDDFLSVLRSFGGSDADCAV